MKRKDASIVVLTATAATPTMAVMMVTVLAANAASMRRSNTRHSKGESGGEGWNTQASAL